MTDKASSTFTWSQWSRLFSELRRRSTQPWQHVTFVVYFLLGVLIFGALGVWIEVVKFFEHPLSTSGISVAMTAFYPALVGTAALQLVYETTETRNKVGSALSLLAMVTFSGGAILANTFENTHPHRVLAWNVIFSIMAVWVWVLVAGSQSFLQTEPPDAETGGNIDRTIPGDFGDIAT